MKIQNVSKEPQAVTGIPAFFAGEIKEVTEEQGYVLLKNDSFKLVKEERKEDPKPADAAEKPVYASKKK